MSTELITLSGETMGTRYSVQFCEGAVVNSFRLAQDLRTAVTAVDQQMSPWIATSVVNQFNDLDVGDWLDLPTETAEVVQNALLIEKQSNGAFSIAVAPQVRHHGFSTDARTTGPAPIMGVLAHDALDFDGKRMRKTEPIEIDVCGIAKGYGADALATVMIAYDISDFMVSIDGELRCQGAPSDDETWQVAIEDPVPSVRQVACVIPCADVSIATSGGYRNFDTTQSDITTHTIDPRTGTPISKIERSVVVAAKDCSTADAWATALTVMPLNEAITVIDTYQLNVLFLASAGDKTVRRGFGKFA